MALKKVIFLKRTKREDFCLLVHFTKCIKGCDWAKLKPETWNSI